MGGVDLGGLRGELQAAQREEASGAHVQGRRGGKFAGWLPGNVAGRCIRARILYRACALGEQSPIRRTRFWDACALVEETSLRLLGDVGAARTL